LSFPLILVGVYYLVTWVLPVAPNLAPLFVSALLGAWPAAAISVYDRIVNVPLLDIYFDSQNVHVHKPSLQVVDRGGTIWNHLRVEVKNSGFAPARDCRAELRVVKRPTLSGQMCPAPSNEPKRIIWSGYYSGEPQTIPSRRGKALLEVLLNDTGIPQKTRMIWHDAKTWGPVIAWVATYDVIKLGPQLRLQDAFCAGTYQIEIDVFPENGTPKGKVYCLQVNSDWDKVSLAPL
jgi:hypothetical protein